MKTAAEIKSYNETVKQIKKLTHYNDKIMKIVNIGDDRALRTIEQVINLTGSIDLISDDYAVLDLMGREHECDIMENYWYDEDWYPRETSIYDEMMKLVNDMQLEMLILNKTLSMQKYTIDIAAACESSRYQSIATHELNSICDPIRPNNLEGWAWTLKQRVTDCDELIYKIRDMLDSKIGTFKKYLIKMEIAAAEELELEVIWQ